MKNPVEVWLWLLLVMQPYNKKSNYILDECNGDAAQAGRNIRDGKYDFLSDGERKNAQNIRMKDVRELMQTCADNNVRIITLDDDDYPPLLRGIDYPPIVLFCAGDVGFLKNSVTLSVVGARKISDYGVKVTHRMIEPLAKLGIAIISGMAVGTDAEAHRACLAQGGKTIGVLGCGILVNYPAQNADLKREIVANGGAVISELLPQSRTFGEYFPTRNRIISGLSLGTLIVEAGEHSGSLLTAKHAVEQERELFCVPPQDLYSSRFNGVVPLLRENAVPVYNFTDILDAFSMYFSNEKYIKDFIEKVGRTEHELKTPRSAKKRDKKKERIGNVEKAEVSENLDAPQIAEVEELPEKAIELSAERLSALSEDEIIVMKLLAETPAKPDDIVEKSELDYGAATEILTNLEISGEIVRRADGNYIVVES